YAVPGRVRLPGAAADKHLLRVCFPDLLAAPVLAQAKRGFTLPIRRWMLGPLRDVCESAMLQVRRSGLLEAREAD
ncbi:asparagine synthase-related protein, partial [Halomonas marinisediminis]